HILDAHRSFQPMNVNFGLFPPLDVPVPKLRGADKGADKKRALSARAAADLEVWRAAMVLAAAE
ncbi:MAG: FADH(2)-oxidizing methylenetetrahydrofolate--tRNA-(uracil(54)-C(5))-methyltransferase TrmFO, partial [Methylovirgula sp.]